MFLCLWVCVGMREPISAVTKSSCNQLSVRIHPCMLRAESKRGLPVNASPPPPLADPICSPSPSALSGTYKTPERHKRVNDSFCFVEGGTAHGQMTTTNPSNLAALGISALSLHRWSAHIARCPSPRSGKQTEGTGQPFSGQPGLDKWLEQTSLSPAGEEPPCSELHHPNSIILCMLFVDKATPPWLAW